MTPVGDHDPLTPTTSSGRSRWPWVVGGVLGLVALAVLAFGVFGVQTLFVEDEVEEAAFEFDSGAVTPEGGPGTGTDATPSPAPDDAADPVGSAPPATTAPQPAVELVATGGFSPGDHPGSGTANIFSDGTQSVVRFEDDFSTDNGPDLFAVVYVGDQRIELGRLKGNQGSQNYELPPDLDPSTIDAVSVWCKRFDSTFTTATVA